MDWNDFVSNVQEWAKARGITDNSTAFAQLEKAVEEYGEVTRARLKDDLDELRDGIGDVLVCLVNAASIFGVDLQAPTQQDLFGTDPRALMVQWHRGVVELGSEFLWGGRNPEYVARKFDALVSVIAHHAVYAGVNLEECQHVAWEAIKDRRGFLSPEGVFIKEEPTVPQGD